MHILRQIQVAQHKTYTQRNPAIIHAVICVYVCGGCYSCPLKFSKKQQPPPPPSPKRATEANGFKQYLIISVIQRQLRLNYHTQNECVGFFWTWPSIRQRPTSWQTYNTRIHPYHKHIHVHNNILLYSLSCFLSTFVSFRPLTKGFCIHVMQTDQASDRERGKQKRRESRRKKLVKLLCTHTMAVHNVDVATIWTQNRRISHFVFVVNEYVE